MEQAWQVAKSAMIAKMRDNNNFILILLFSPTSFVRWQWMCGWQGKGFSSIWTELKQVGGFDGISCVTLIWVTPVSDGMLAKFVFL